VLFKNKPASVFRSLQSIGRSTDLAIGCGSITSVELIYGDCSDEPIFTADILDEFASKHCPHVKITYVPFGKNLGSAAGHNQLLSASNSEAVLIQNPDIIPAPDAIIELMKPFAHATTGMVEARQLPIEHPKDYDEATGETGWATTACCMIPRTLLERLKGFDSESFFLYCDDLDFSWRARLAGYKVIYQPSAAVFHDKTLSPAGRWEPSPAEKYYSAEASLMMAHKWSRPDRVKSLRKKFEVSGDPNLIKAAKVYSEKARTNRLCVPLDPQHKIGEFHPDNNYTKHRYVL
jgi:GT2 family glycosyltransferase